MNKQERNSKSYVPLRVLVNHYIERDVLTSSVLDADPTTKANAFDNVGGDISGGWQQQ